VLVPSKRAEKTNKDMRHKGPALGPSPELTPKPNANGNATNTGSDTTEHNRP